jgi:hypothetical protein
MGNVHGGNSSGGLNVPDRYKQMAADASGELIKIGRQHAMNAWDKIVEDAKKRAVEKIQSYPSTSVSGGTCCTGGSPNGYKALVDYSNSVFSQEKEKLIRGIASDVSSILKVKSDFADSAPIDKVVDKLQSIVPDPRKGKHFVKDVAIQGKVCKAFASSINKRYGSNVIDANADPAAICQSIGELMYSLFTGLHTEFLSVSADIGKIVTNLKALRDYVDASNKRLRDLVSQSGTQAQQSQADNAYDIYEKLRNEIDRQLAILTNIVNSTTSPLSKNLVSLLENNNEFKGLIQDLRVTTGSEAFGDKLGYLLSGVSSVSHAAQIIDKALKDLGMSVKDYTDTKSLADFRTKVYAHMGKSSPSSSELRKMLEAADIIYRTDYDHANIVKHLEDNMSKKRGGVGSLDDDAYDLEEATEKELGQSRGYMSRKSLGLQMKENRRFRQMLFKDLKTLLRGNFQKIVDSVNGITRLIGSDIPISDNLYKFVVRFGQIESPDRENLHLALSGYRRDLTSKHVKSTFMASLRAVHATLEPLKSGPHGAQFKAIQDAIATLIKSVDDFSDKFVKSMTEIPADMTKTPRGGQYAPGDVPGSALGGDAVEELGQVVGSASSPGDFEYFTSMEKVQKELNYYYSISNLKSNLGRASAELESYGQDYENILGDEIASLVDQINTDFNRDIELADVAAYRQIQEPDYRQKSYDANRAREFEEYDSLGRLLYDASQDEESIIGRDPNMATAISDTYKYVRTYQKNAKINLLKAAEALDLYMKNFTTAVVAHPDDIKDLSAMLGQITIVAKWFTNRTGDHLAALFESWPADIIEGQPTWSNGQRDHPGDSIYQEITSGGSPHYYAWVDAHKQNGLGNPSIPWYPTGGRNEVRDTFRRVEKSYAGMRALENLVSTFSRIGDKFGDKSIKDSSFMSHAQMYKAISDYLVASSISMGATGDSLANAELMSLIASLNGPDYDDYDDYDPDDPDAPRPASAADKRNGGNIMIGLGVALLVLVLVGATLKHMKGKADAAAAAGNQGWLSSQRFMGKLLDKLGKKALGAALLISVILSGVGIALREGKIGGGDEKESKLVQFGKIIGAVANGDWGSVLASLMKLFHTNIGQFAKASLTKYSVEQLFGKSPSLMTYTSGKTELTIPETAFTINEISQKDPSLAMQAGYHLIKFLAKHVQPLLKYLPNANKTIKQHAPALEKMVTDIVTDTSNVGSAMSMLSNIAGATGGATGGAWYIDNARVNYADIEPGDDAAAEVFDRIALTLRSTEDVGYNDDFGDTDHILQLMLKSMACKMLTIVGVYSLFNRPGSINRSITPLRMILGAGSGVRGGGSESAMPPVIDDAVELYIRLPLLAEWYREKFGFKKTGDVSSDYMVSMVPSFDGVWSDFVRIIFVDTEHIRDGSYTDLALQKLIVVINEIYKKYAAKYPKTTVREVINAFVTEINRRYGFIKKNEINDYFDATRQHLASQGEDPYPDDERVDYDILDSSRDYGRKPAPSDRFQKVSPGPRGSHRFAEKEHLMLAAIQFREKVELEMMELSASFNKNLQDRTLSDNKYSFVENIMQVTQKLHNAKSGDERYEIVRDTIQGVNKFAGISYEKTLLFNEVVITPITVLSTLHTSLDKFCSFVHGTNLRILGKIAKDIGDSYADMALSNDYSDPLSFSSLVKKTIMHKYPNIRPERCERLVECLWYYADMGGLWLDIGENENPIRLTKGVAFKQADWGATNQEAWRRFIINRKALMKDLLNAVFHIGCDLNGLVESRVSAAGAPVVDYSKLQDVSVTLFNQVKSAVGEFRAVMSKETIDRFESTGEGSSYMGSLLWIEENLIEILFNNRDKAGLPEVNESIASTWADLTRPWNFTAASFTDPVDLPDGGLNKDTYNDVLSELIYWNHKTDSDGETRTDAEYNAFPALYTPYFKSGAFEPSTNEEKLAYAQLGKIPSVSPEVLKTELAYHKKKFGDMLMITGLSLVTPNFPSVKRAPALVSGTGMLPTVLRMSQEVVVNRAVSIAHTMLAFVRWFITNGYSEDTFLGGAQGAPLRALSRISSEEALRPFNLLLHAANNRITSTPYTIVQAGDRDKTYVANIQAVLNMIPIVPGASGRVGRTLPQAGLDALRTVALSTISATSGVDMLSLFPDAGFSLSAVQMFILLTFGASNPSDFTGFHSNIYIVRLHAIAKRMVDWLLQAAPPSHATQETSYQVLDQDTRSSTMSIFLDWQKELTALTTNYMEEMAKISVNIEKAMAISESYRKMRMVSNYSQWYMREPSRPDSWGNPHQGIIPVFNELLARYIVGFGDRSQYSRIYLPLIDSFANGSNSREIMQGDGIKDVNFSPEFIAAHMGGKGVKGDPPYNTLLYASLGRVIKSVLTRTIPSSQIKYHILTNFAEVPEFVKESLRANLPVLDKEFEYLSKKAQFLKAVIESGHDTESGGVSVRRVINPEILASVNSVIGDYNSDPGLHGGMIPPSNQGHDERRPYLVSLINSVVSGCASIQRCMDITQKELADVPLYGETFEGSMKQFRARHNVNPLTPLSSLTFLFNRSARQDNWLTPAFGVGSAKFKNLYSTRLILAQSKVDPKIDYAPGMRDIVAKYNAVSDGTTQAPSYYNAIFHQVIQLTRYLTDIGYHKDITGRFLNETLTAGEGDHPAQYSFGTMDRVMALSENIDIKRAATDITSRITESEGARGEDRKTLRIYNILDLNIVPINVHAMQREVPLINLYNYSYTFDRMIQESLIPNWKTMLSVDSNVRLVIRPTSAVATTKGMLAKCLMFPHGPRSEEEYYGHIRRLMMGSTGLNIGRPKYLSDQLWGKVLLQDMFPNGDGDPEMFDEAGPAHELSLLKGYNEGVDNPDPWRTPKLSYQAKNGPRNSRSNIATIDLDPDDVASMGRIGYIRYNTHIVRNQEWITNLQLYVRYLMREALKWVDTPVVTGHNVLSQKVTSYHSNEGYSPEDFQ